MFQFFPPLRERDECKYQMIFFFTNSEIQLFFDIFLKKFRDIQLTMMKN